MKTFNAILIIGMFLGQFTFGKGNDTCCPDTSSVQLVAAVKEAELDLLQTESHHLILSVPTLENQVTKKLNNEVMVLDLLQTESEDYGSGHADLFNSHVRAKLTERRMQEVQIVEQEIVKF